MNIVNVLDERGNAVNLFLATPAHFRRELVLQTPTASVRLVAVVVRNDVSVAAKFRWKATCLKQDQELSIRMKCRMAWINPRVAPGRPDR
jgi:hypothetical protein